MTCKHKKYTSLNAGSSALDGLCRLKKLQEWFPKAEFCLFKHLFRWAKALLMAAEWKLIFLIKNKFSNTTLDFMYTGNINPNQNSSSETDSC